MNDAENKKSILEAIRDFEKKPLRQAACQLFATLGYQSNRTIPIDSVDAFCEQFDAENRLNHASAQKDQWKSIHLLFQITDQELSGQGTIFQDTSVKSSLLQSYVFFAIELSSGDYPRGKLAAITRQINRIFPMPVMVLFRMGDKISLSVINRRQHKRDENKDVLGKVTLIQNISINKPHPGHVDIIASFSTRELIANDKLIGNFDQLHAAWEEVFNVELLNKRFYQELSNWYFWARRNVSFPADLEPDEEKRNSTSVIRLITRLIFCWFLKEKGLIPENLFDKDQIAEALVSLADDDSTYYRAILQNLFFATLNQQMNTKGKTRRQFVDDKSVVESRTQNSNKNLYRYKDAFRDSAKALSLFEDIPFLNGGLFACLDPLDDNGKVLYADGFSRKPEQQPIVPNYLFFSERQTVDLSVEYGETQKKKENVRGLLNILRNYKFTIAENTPVEQEIALDPELLGKVFENLLASYNPETCTTARTQTGSFYTPRPIVDYMVDESLKAYLARVMQDKIPGITTADARAGLDILFAYTEREHAFSEEEIDVLITAIDTCNILDPACGSGAFPMGILHKLVFILGKLDPHNEKWRDRQIAKASEIEDIQARGSAIHAIKRDFEDNALDYGRKLYLIENCIYGVDIQPIAIQIAKLRFFISLVCDQKVNRDKSKNHGIRPLPNLETKFVAANTLISLTRETQVSMFANPKVQQLEKELETIRHSYFSAQTLAQKNNLEQQDKDLCQKIIRQLAQLSTAAYTNEDATKKIATWNPYDAYTAADFFDAEWMFGRSLADGFDVVIGNPPYIKEDVNKSAFEGLKGTEYYQGKMDIWYLFGCRGLDLLKSGGILSFIATNNWVTNDGASIFRNKLVSQAKIVAFIDFGNYKIFSASVQTMILISSKTSEEPKYGLDYARVNNDKITPIQLSEFLSAPFEVSTPDFEKYRVAEFIRSEYKDNYISFIPPRISNILIKMKSEADIYLKSEEIFSGIDVLQDFVSKNHLPVLGQGPTIGDGIFVLSNAEKDSVQWNTAELAAIKPYYRPKEINRYYANKSNQYWILYTGAHTNKSISDFPNIKKHLDKFQKVLTSVNKPYGLHRTRKEAIFLGEKIFCIRKCVRPSFAFVDFPSYVSRAFLIIKTARMNMKVLLAILNSKLVSFWLLYKGKRQGDQHQVDTVPLQLIPIKTAGSQQRADELIALVDQLIDSVNSESLTADLRAEIAALESRIDALVYQLYGLTSDEVEIIESVVASSDSSVPESKLIAAGTVK